jgi:aldose sugar dehydrogenase
MKLRPILLALLLGVSLVATWQMMRAGDSEAKAAPAYAPQNPFTATELAKFDEPWAMAIDPGTGAILVTEKRGRIKLVEPNGTVGTVTGVPEVAYGGQGGLGDIVFAPAPRSAKLDKREVYLSWAEPGPDDTRGAAVARADLVCADKASCSLQGLQVIWRQQPKTTGKGHYSHRITFAPDGRSLFIASGDRQKMQPAQDMAGNLGKVVHLMLDGTPAPDNPFADKGGVTAQIWSLGHRNILGMRFDAQGRLWDLEHGPRGGDELNLVEKGKNYGWPLVSMGQHYNGGSIPKHSTRPEFAAPAISWDPVIAPGDFIFYRGNLFRGWRGQALIAGLASQGVVRVAIDKTKAREVARYDMQARIRSIAEREDGSLLVLEDGEGGRLLHLTSRQR